MLWDFGFFSTVKMQEPFSFWGRREIYAQFLAPEHPIQHLVADTSSDKEGKNLAST